MAIWRRKRGIGVSLTLVLAAFILSMVLPCRTKLMSADNSGLRALFAHSGLIRSGQTGELVRSLQEVLAVCGYMVAVDGDFGPKTESVLMRFQKDNGLYPDGIAGPATFGVLSGLYYRANPPERHTVKSGESLSSIGDMYGVSVEDLVRINKLPDADLVFAGQVLLIKADPEEERVPVQEEPALPPEPPASFPIPDRRICLTFDDGPDLTTTRPILAILKQYGVRATFFLVGNRVLQHPDLVKEIALDGHVIGVHGFEHKVLSGLPAREVQSDLMKAQDAILQVTGVTPWLYRPPSGALDQTQVTEASKLGMRVVMWTNIGGADLGATSHEDVAARTVTAATDGGIIMLHEGLQYTVEALPSLIEALARLGYGFQNPGK